MKTNSKTSSKPLNGIIPPIVTPLLSQDKLDTTGLERLIEHLIKAGVHGIFVLGSTGEGPNLSYDLRNELIERVCELVRNRVPVLVGITDTSFKESVNLANIAWDAGADAVVTAPPYYFPASQPELLEYIKHLTKIIRLPLVLYNIPCFTKTSFEPDTVKAAADIEGVIGLKDSSKDMDYFQQIQSLFEGRPNFALLMGQEILMAKALLSGWHGGVPGGAMLAPRLYVDLYNACISKDTTTVEALQQKVEYICNNIYTIGPNSSDYIKGIKCALSCMGLCSDFIAEPFKNFGPAERAEIQYYLNELEIL